MRWFNRRKSRNPERLTEPHPAPSPDRPLETGDMVTVNYHRYYEPGRIEHAVTSHEISGEVVPLYRVNFGRFELHLTADELTRDNGTGIDTRPLPGWLQNIFCDLLATGEAHQADGNTVDKRWLTGKFYNHGDTLPRKACQQAGLDVGTTYAQAARRLRRDMS